MIERFVASIESIAESMAKIAESMEPKRGRRPKEEPVEPLPEAVEDNADLRKIVRQEFKRVVIAKGEKAAEELLQTYGVLETSDLPDASIPDFLTDAAALADAEPEKPKKKEKPKEKEISYDELKKAFQALARKHGNAPALEILGEYGVKKLQKLEKKNYKGALKQVVAAMEAE